MAKEKHLSYTKLVTINWFQQLFQFFKEQVVNGSKIKHKFYLKKVIIQRFDEILEPILSLLSHEEEEVRKAATLTNDLLLQIMDNIKREEPINLNKVIPLLKDMLSEKKSSSTSECVLTWMKFLLENYNDKILIEINDIIQKLVEKLCEGNTKNVMAIIENVSFT
jgi:vacuole morphology and inheritance protein 14